MRIVLWIAVVVASLAAWPGRAEDVPSLLREIEAVGSEGAGYATAARAWQELARVDAARLPELLAGLDRAGPLAANWIRTAVDALAERQLRRGGKLPTAALEAFVLDQRHVPRARRLAYEWLAQIDASAPQRLLPTMLDDPGRELRRDAVAWHIARAEALEKAGGKDQSAAIAAYRLALDAANDVDHVQRLAERLRRLGQKVDVPRQLGLVVHWKVIGPFDNTGQRGFDRADPPEQPVDFKASYPGKHGTVRWIDVAAADDLGQIDLNRALGAEKGVAAYAAGEFFATQQAEVEFRMASFNAVKLWLNGRLLDAHNVYHSGSQWDQYTSRGTLRPGRNLILVKVCQNEQTQDWAVHWWFQFRVCDQRGRAVLSAPPEGRKEPGGARATQGRQSGLQLVLNQEQMLCSVVGPKAQPSPSPGQRPGETAEPPSPHRANGPTVVSGWRQFRGTDNTSVSHEKGLPRSFDAATGQSVAWKAPLVGRGPSSPIVVGDCVIVTAATGPSQDRLHVLCFDAATGKPRWHRQLWATGSTICNPFGGVASPTPASDGRRIFALFSSGDLACFDLEGNLQWFRGLGFESPLLRNDVGMGASPLATDDMVVVQLQTQGESFAAGIDAAGGATRWRLPRERDAIWSSPTLLRGASGGRDLVLMQGRKKLSAHDPDNGKQRWDFEAWVDTISSVTTCGDMIYLPAVGLHALQAKPDGGVRPLWYQQRLRLENSSPVAAGDRVYFIKPPGILVALRAGDGQPAWQLRLQGPVWATPVLADGRLYVVSYDGLVQIVEPGRNEGRLVGTGRIDAEILASPAVAGGAIYLRSNAHLWKLASMGDGRSSYGPRPLSPTLVSDPSRSERSTRKQTAATEPEDNNR